jgi:hypothetical protein
MVTLRLPEGRLTPFPHYPSTLVTIGSASVAESPGGVSPTLPFVAAFLSLSFAYIGFRGLLIMDVYRFPNLSHFPLPPSVPAQGPFPPPALPVIFSATDPSATLSHQACPSPDSCFTPQLLGQRHRASRVATHSICAHVVAITPEAPKGLRILSSSRDLRLI